MGKGAVQTLPHSQETSPTDYSNVASAQNGLGARPVQKIVTDPRSYFAIVQRTYPDFIRVNHVKQTVLCHESYIDQAATCVSYWNAKFPTQSYKLCPLAANLWQKTFSK